LTWPHRKKSKGVRSGDLAGQFLGPSRPIQRLGYSWFKSPLHLLQNEAVPHPVGTNGLHNLLKVHDPVDLVNFLVKIVDNVHHLILPEIQMVQSTK
jgi:hypothetical protein